MTEKPSNNCKNVLRKIDETPRTPANKEVIMNLDFKNSASIWVFIKIGISQNSDWDLARADHAGQTREDFLRE